LYIAGDAAGVAGAEAAELRGRLAGLAAAADAGRLTTADERSQVASWRRAVDVQERFGRAVRGLMRVPSGLYDTVTPATVVCRCEDVTRQEIESAMTRGAREASEIKAWTRCGMGPCQGRLCRETLTALLGAPVAGTALEGAWTPRPPIRPVPLDLLVGSYEYADIRLPGAAPR
jgi:bacterioferritin-associated ferredoxin